MARHTKEWNEGYQAAIEAIKKALSGEDGGNGQGGSSDNMPDGMTPPPPPKGGKGGKGGQNGKGGNSRTSANDADAGVVRPEDCEPIGKGVDCPETAGGFFSKEEGDKLAQAEGYEKEGGNDKSLEQDWKETAVKAVSSMEKSGIPGDVAGRFKSTIEGLYKSSKDWKKDLEMIVGRAINDAETRQAYANKNILISQDRIARTSKDEYNTLDYMLVAIDSSGSMSDEDLRVMLSEVYAIAEAKKAINLVVVQCDTQIQEVKEYKSLDDFKRDSKFATVKGRGGTDMTAVLKWLRTDRYYSQITPDIVMVFSDSDSRCRQFKRDDRHMSWLVWCILDDPSFRLQYPDALTKIFHVKSSDLRK